MDILKSFMGLFAKQNESVLGIDIGASAIKVVQIRRKRGRAVLETYGELALGPYAGIEMGRATSLDTPKLIEAVRDILKESKTTTTACGIALPLSSSLISFITIPPVEEKQLKDVVTIEARKYIPVPMNEVMLDWSIIPKEDVPLTDSEIASGGADGSLQSDQKKKPQDVLVVAIHNEYLNTYQSIATGAGLQPSFYEIELFGAIRAVIDQGLQPVMIVDMGARLTKLYIVERGILRSSHVINKGGQDITLAIAQSLSIPIADAEQQKRAHGLKGGPEHKELTELITVNLDYIFYEANAVLLAYQRKYAKNVGKIVMTGGGVLLRGLSDLAKVSFQTEVVYAEPFSKLVTPAFLNEQFATAGPEFSVAIGIALRRLSELE